MKYLNIFQKEKLYLVNVKNRNIDKVKSDLINEFQKDKGIIYVTFDEPFISLITKFKEKKINTESIFFIDATKKTFNESINCFIIKNPMEISEIILSIQKVLDYYVAKEKGSSNAVIIFDSIVGMIKLVPIIKINEFLQTILNICDLRGVKSLVLVFGTEIESKGLDKIKKLFKKIVNIG